MKTENILKEGDFLSEVKCKTPFTYSSTNPFENIYLFKNSKSENEIIKNPNSATIGLSKIHYTNTISNKFFLIFNNNICVLDNLGNIIINRDLEYYGNSHDVVFNENRCFILIYKGNKTHILSIDSNLQTLFQISLDGDCIDQNGNCYQSNLINFNDNYIHYMKLISEYENGVYKSTYIKYQINKFNGEYEIINTGNTIKDSIKISDFNSVIDYLLILNPQCSFDINTYNKLKNKEKEKIITFFLSNKNKINYPFLLKINPFYLNVIYKDNSGQIINTEFNLRNIKKLSQDNNIKHLKIENKHVSQNLGQGKYEYYYKIKNTNSTFYFLKSFYFPLYHTGIFEDFNFISNQYLCKTRFDGDLILNQKLNWRDDVLILDVIYQANTDKYICIGFFKLDEGNSQYFIGYLMN